MNDLMPGDGTTMRFGFLLHETFLCKTGPLREGA
jgi:hypothetical protein